LRCSQNNPGVAKIQIRVKIVEKMQKDPPQIAELAEFLTLRDWLDDRG